MTEWLIIIAACMAIGFVLGRAYAKAESPDSSAPIADVPTDPASVYERFPVVRNATGSREN